VSVVARFHFHPNDEKIATANHLVQHDDVDEAPYGMTTKSTHVFPTCSTGERRTYGQYHRRVQWFPIAPDRSYGWLAHAARCNLVTIPILQLPQGSYLVRYVSGERTAIVRVQKEQATEDEREKSADLALFSFRPGRHVLEPFQERGTASGRDRYKGTIPQLGQTTILVQVALHERKIEQV
jgi:hypothetical protein